MNRTTVTCIAGMRSKTTTGIKTHFQRPKKPRGPSLLRGFGLGIFAKRLRWRPSATRRDDVLSLIAYHVQHPVQKQGRPVSNQRNRQAERLRNTSFLPVR
jgi:hypothetical protein